MLSKKKKFSFLIVPTHWRWSQIFVASSCLCGWEWGGGGKSTSLSLSHFLKRKKTPLTLLVMKEKVNNNRFHRTFLHCLFFIFLTLFFPFHGSFTFSFNIDRRCVEIVWMKREGGNATPFLFTRVFKTKGEKNKNDVPYPFSLLHQDWPYFYSPHTH